MNEELKWQQFLALVTEIDEKTQNMVETISTNEIDSEVKKELTPADLLATAPATPSHDEEKPIKITKVEKNV